MFVLTNILLIFGNEKRQYFLLCIHVNAIHCVVHIIHFFTTIEPQRMSGIVLGFVDLNENPMTSSIQP